MKEAKEAGRSADYALPLNAAHLASSFAMTPSQAGWSSTRDGIFQFLRLVRSL